MKNFHIRAARREEVGVVLELINEIGRAHV